MRSISDIFNVRGVTTEQALEIIADLTPEQILEQDKNGNTILHMLAPSEQDAWDMSFNLETVVNAIVAKNAEVLNLRSSAVYTDPKTNEEKSIDGDNALEAAIRHNSLKLLKILAPYHKKEFKVFDYRAGEQRNKTPEEIEKTKENFNEAEDFRLPTIKTLDNVREFISPLAFALRYGQFEIFKYLVENGCGQGIKGIQNMPLYNLDTKEDLQDFYKDLFVAGNKDLLKELHRFLGYYEGHNGQNSPELITALGNGNIALALDLISQGHYIYNFNRLSDSTAAYIFSKCFAHPNYNIWARDNSGFTTLYHAVNNGDNELMKSILEAAEYNYNFLKSSFDNRDFFNANLLFRAAMRNDTKLIAELISAIKDYPDLLRTALEPMNRFGDNALTVCAAHRNKEVIEMFLSAGVCPPLSTLLNKLLPTEMKFLLLKGCVKSKAYNAFSAGWNVLEGAAKAMSGDITEFYDEQVKNIEQSRDRGNQR